MRTKKSWTVVVVLGCGLLLPTLAMNGMSAVRRSPVAAPMAASTAPWVESLATVDAALTRGNVSGALTAWHLAYAAALHDPRWEGLMVVGDARLRIERAAGFERRGKEQARMLYLMALLRARQQGAVDGALRVATAFDVLGDREAAAHAVHVAATLEERRQGAATTSVPTL